MTNLDGNTLPSIIIKTEDDTVDVPQIQNGAVWDVPSDEGSVTFEIVASEPIYMDFFQLKLTGTVKSITLSFFDGVGTKIAEVCKG